MKIINELVFREMTEADINNIINLNYKNFTEDRFTVMNKYIGVLNDSNKHCTIVEDTNGTFLGYIQYSILNQALLKEKYPKGVSYFNDLTGNVLYLSELIIDKKFQCNGIASELLLHTLDVTKNAQCNSVLAFAVKDGTTGNINANKLLNNHDFVNQGNVVDMWNQSRQTTNYCPTCSKQFEICHCTAVVFTKSLEEI